MTICKVLFQALFMGCIISFHPHSNPEVGAIGSCFTYEEMEIAVFSLCSLFLVKGQEPWPYAGRGLRYQPQFIAVRTLDFCFPTPFSPLLSFLPFFLLFIHTSLSAPDHTPIPYHIPKNPVSRAESDVFVGIETDTPPQMLCIQEQTGGTGGNVAQWTLLSVPVTRSRLSGTVAIHGQGIPGLSRHPAHRQFPAPMFWDPPQGLWNFFPDIQSRPALDL